MVLNTLGVRTTVVPVFRHQEHFDRPQTGPARARSHTSWVVGNHRQMECATGPEKIQHGGLRAVARRCGHWVLDFRIRP